MAANVPPMLGASNLSSIRCLSSGRLPKDVNNTLATIRLSNIPTFNVTLTNKRKFEVTILTGDLYFHPDFTGCNISNISDLYFVPQTGTATSLPTIVNPAGLSAVQPANISNYTIGPAEHMSEHAALEAELGYSYCTLLSELFCMPMLSVAPTLAMSSLPSQSSPWLPFASTSWPSNVSPFTYTLTLAPGDYTTDTCILAPSFLLSLSFPHP